MTRYLVTGGAGFIGSHLVERLLDEGHQVVVVDDESADSNEEFFWDKRAENHKVDITDYESLVPLFEGVTGVFHFAAEARIQPAIKNPSRAASVNVLGTCNVLQAARTHGVDRVIYSSTSSAYGRKNTPPLREDMPNDCLNPYSVTKVAGEELCKMYTNLFGLNTVILRYFNVYGERQPLKGQYAPVVGIFQRQVAAGEPMTIVGDGGQKRDFTYVKDVANANFLAMTSVNNEIFGETFNVGTGTNISVLELASLIGDEVVHIPERLGESRATLADARKINSMMGWEPTIFIQDWLSNEK
jgi:UDP-glucose 4-epimerase